MVSSKWINANKTISEIVQQIIKQIVKQIIILFVRVSFIIVILTYLNLGHYDFHVNYYHNANSNCLMYEGVLDSFVFIHLVLV